MAKVSFTKLGLTKNTSVKEIEYNGQTIEVKQYLPFEDKIRLIARAIDAAANADSAPYIDSVKVGMFFELEKVYAYTNITFTEKQQQDATKTFDLLNGSGLLDKIIEAMDEHEEEYLFEALQAELNDKINYDRSLLAIADVLTQDYNALSFDAEQIKENISDPENLKLVKDVLTKLG